MGIIPRPSPSKVILVDACLSGIGGTDGQKVYGQQLTPTKDGAVNITELEMANVVVALHTLLTPADAGSHIRIKCDNQAAVSVLKKGKADNHVIQDCARAVWMAQAILGVDVSYDHIPGRDNDVADALSRAHLSHHDRQRADDWVAHYSVNLVPPCLYYLCNPDVPIRCRSGAVITASPRGQPSGEGPSSGHDRQPQGGSERLHSLHGNV